MSYFGPLVSLFGISGDVFSVFQRQSGFCLIFCKGKCTLHSLRSTCSAAPANILTASLTTSHIPTCISRGGSLLGFEQAITRTEDERATIVTWFPFKTLFEAL